MASRVNVRFVVFLAIGLIVLAGGVVVVGVYALRKGAPELAAMGDKMMQEAAGEVDATKKAKAYDQASLFYSRAVFREPTSPEYCRKWRESMEKMTPTPQQAYIDKFRQDYTSSWVGLRNAAPQDVEVQREFLEWRYDQINKFSAGSVEAWRALATDAQEAIDRFDDPSQAAALNRYVAIANVAIIRMQGAAQSTTMLEPTKAAIAAALKADPADAETVNARSSLMVLEAADLRAKDPAGADTLIQDARELLVNYLSAHPESTRVRLTLLQLEMNQAVIAAKNKLTWGQLYINFNDKLLELLEAVKKEKPESFDVATAAAAAGMAMTSPRLGPEGAVAFLDSLLAVHPTNASLLMAKGRAAMRANKPDEAIRVFQKVADLPEVPLSLEGVYLFGQRAEAMVQQVTAKLAQITNETTAEQRAEIIKEANAYRQKLVEYTGEGETALLLLDARVLLAEQKMQAARIKLGEFNQKTDNKNYEGLMLQGQILMMSQDYGAAKQQFENVLRRDPGTVSVIYQIMQIERLQQNYEAAIARCDEILTYQPANQEIIALRQELEEISNATDPTKTVSPVIRALARSRDLAAGVGQDFKGAAAIIREAMKTEKDVRLHRVLVQYLASADDRAGALVAANEGLRAFPDDATLVSFARDLSQSDPTQQDIDRINRTATADELTKAVSRALVYRRDGKLDQAREEIAKAAAINPSAPGVIELQFGEAVRAQNMDEAKRLADAAAKAGKDGADNVGGLTFRARVEMLEKRFAEAATTLEETLLKDKFNVGAWRLLGAVREQLGQLEAAGKAYDKALEIKNDDPESIVGTLRVRLSQRSYASALSFAREKQPLVGGSPEFVDLWLMSEAIAPGGDRTKAIEARRTLRNRLPDDEKNNYALAVLLIDARQWDESRTLIDALRAKSKDNVKYLEVDAHWNLAQGNPGGAATVFNDYIKVLPADKHNEDPYISLAGLLMRYGQTRAAVITLMDGVKHQDPRTMRADRELAETYFALGEYDKAIEVFEKIAASKPTDLPAVQTRILSALVRGGRLRDARARLDAMGDGVISSDASMLILRADILAGIGDRDGALKAYDQAIAVQKGNAFAFVKRGDFLMGDPSRERDAEDDLRQAVQIDQRMYVARQRLAVLYTRQSKYDEAAKVLKEGLIVDPDNNSMRQDLIDVYLIAKQPEKVVIEVEQAIQRAPSDTTWLTRGRELMAKLGKWDAAAGYGSRLWDRNKVAGNAIGYVDAMLKTEKPDLATALAVLTTPELNTAKDPRLLILRSRVQLKRGKATEATQDMATALSLVDPARSPAVGQFFVGLESIYPQAKDRLAALKVLEPKSGYKSWFSVWLNKLKADTPETSAEGLAALRQIGESSEPIEVRAGAYAAIGARLHDDKKHEEALAAWRAGLQVDPNEPELNNNVAFTLATIVNRPQEAVPYAEKAALALPNNSSVLDTLGAVHLALKNFDKAESALLQAQAYADGEGERTAVFLHMALLRSAQGNKTEAMRFVTYAQEIMRQSDDVRARFTEDFQKVKAEVEAK